MMKNSENLAPSMSLSTETTSLEVTNSEILSQEYFEEDSKDDLPTWTIEEITSAHDSMDIEIKNELIDHTYSVLTTESMEDIKKEELDSSKNPCSSITYREDNSSATSLDPNTFEFGNLSYHVLETKYVRKSTATGFHIQRLNGNMNIMLTAPLSNFEPCSNIGPLYIRAMLVRKHEEYKHDVINTVCTNHTYQTDPQLIEHVMQSYGEKKDYWYDNQGTRKSICFWIAPHENEMCSKNINLKFICSSTCQITKDLDACPERSREMYILLTLESASSNEIIARRKIDIWVKAAICLRDLNKLTRMESKGSAAQFLMKTQKQKKIALKQKCRFLVSIAKKYKFTRKELTDIISETWNMPVKNLWNTN